jgi:hypothetical protein
LAALTVWGVIQLDHSDDSKRLDLAKDEIRVLGANPVERSPPGALRLLNGTNQVRQPDFGEDPILGCSHLLEDAEKW